MFQLLIFASLLNSSLSTSRSQNSDSQSVSHSQNFSLFKKEWSSGEYFLSQEKKLWDLYEPIKQALTDPNFDFIIAKSHSPLFGNLEQSELY